MNIPAIHEAVTSLEQELAAIDQRRGELCHAIDALRSVLGDKPSYRIDWLGADTPPPAPLGARDWARTVIDVLKAEGGCMRPGHLAEALGLDRETLRRLIKPLLAAGTVLASGATMNRRYRLPGVPDRPAKEEVSRR